MLKIEERKRRRGDPIMQSSMDLDMGLNNVGPQGLNQQPEAVILQVI